MEIKKNVAKGTKRRQTEEYEDLRETKSRKEDQERRKKTEHGKPRGKIDRGVGRRRERGRQRDDGRVWETRQTKEREVGGKEGREIRRAAGGINRGKERWTEDKE